MPDSTPTLTDEQREVLKAALDREWPMPTLMDDVAETVARMVADAEQRGRAEVSAAVEAVLDERESLDREGRDAYVAPLLGNRAVALIETPTVRAVLADPAAAVARLKAEALREAADAYPWRDAGGVTDAPGGAKHWLRDHADQIGGGA